MLVNSNEESIPEDRPVHRQVVTSLWLLRDAPDTRLADGLAVGEHKQVLLP